MIAALYVAAKGCYYGLPDVEPWGLPERDARTYAGPHPVVAHPPCERWGRYWHGGPNSVRFPRVRRVKGDDGGCFAAAIAAVRTWGGVLEHPAHSHAWRFFGLPAPMSSGWWRDVYGGWCAQVEQGHYGHRARKATWLYYVGEAAPPPLTWGPSARTVKMDAGFHSADERRRAIRPPAGMSVGQRAERREWLARYAEATGKEYCTPERMNKRECAATPLPFRDLLLSIARTARTKFPGEVRPASVQQQTEPRAPDGADLEQLKVTSADEIFGHGTCSTAVERGQTGFRSPASYAPTPSLPSPGDNPSMGYGGASRGNGLPPTAPPTVGHPAQVATATDHADPT